jgi:ATP-dependent RNA helicase DDX27
MDVASLIAAKRRSLRKPEEKAVSESSANGEKESSDDEEKIETAETSSEEDEDDGSGSEDDTSGSDDDDEEEVDDANTKMEEDIIKTRMGREENETDDKEESEEDEDESDDDEDVEEAEEAEKASKFFETQSRSGSEDVEVFAQLTLSRPLLRGIAAMGYVKPTEIQSSVIPVSLAGRDICASAVTGSGKTAAFLLPILERLLYRSPGRIKALILTPTRELAAQCIGMMSTLSQFTQLQSTLIVGGSKNSKSQQAELRARPQVVVATPGRLLDHITNSAGVSLEDVEFLVLDEADRLLDLGFQDEVQEIIKACPVDRQTLLFSATMNTKVDDLIKLSMKRPVRIKISSKAGKTNKDLEVAPRLEQEFIRVRSGNEGINREGMLLALLTRTFSTQTIVFFDTKAKAHRMMILCGLCGIKCTELHGNLSQGQRLEALEQFRKGEADVLLATDLAARGLDISRVQTVVNFEMPNKVETYIHRIGRTARAGRGGRSCTLIGEGRRHLMKEIMKDAADKKLKVAERKQDKSRNQTAMIRSRSIPAAVIAHFVLKLYSLEEHVEDVLQAEAIARMDRVVEMEAARAQNIIEHSDEIKARPQKQWFASTKEKKLTKEAAAEKAQLIREKVGTGVHRMTRKKRRSREAREDFENQSDGDDDNEDTAAQRAPSMKMIAREHKRDLEDKEREKSNRSIHDMNAEKPKKKRKGAKAADASGDGSLFADEKIAYAPKKKDGEEERVKSSYAFQGYDATKDGKKKPKQKAHHKFKSKSKFKRR